MRGWNTRRNEWQLGGGIQHEFLPRVSGELTYNWRKYGNLTDTDVLNMGCDYYGQRAASGLDANRCFDEWQNFNDPGGMYDFFSFDVPEDPQLPGGGGYTIRGLTDERQNGALPTQGGEVTLIRSQREYYWQGFDTNLVYRGPRGLRLSGGTSTGTGGAGHLRGAEPRPTQRERSRGERAWRRLPIEGAVADQRPGERQLHHSLHRRAGRGGLLVSARGAADRHLGSRTARGSTGKPAARTVRARSFEGSSASSPTMNINLLDNYDLVSEGTRQTDLTFRKNIRFAGKRLTRGCGCL